MEYNNKIYTSWCMFDDKVPMRKVIEGESMIIMSQKGKFQIW